MSFSQAVRGLAAVFLIGATASAQNGHLMTGFGPENQAMGGAATGYANDAAGALFWNVASIGALERDEMAFSLELFELDATLKSSVEADAFGPGVPAGRVSGESHGTTEFPVPSIALVVHSEDPGLTYGLGVFGVGGFGVDYSSSLGNPIATPPPPNGFGFGAIFSNFALLQVCPSVAYELDDRWSIGFSPCLSWAAMAIDPFAATTPDDANSDGFPSYPGVSHQTTARGIGFQLATYFEDDRFSAGVSVRTPVWFEKFRWQTSDEVGGPRREELAMDVPAMISVGAGYRCTDRLGLAADLRYIAYGSTRGFRIQGFGADGAVRGFGWDSIFVAAVGARYQLTERCALLGGYSFNQSPLDGDDTMVNVVAPAILQHHLNLGVSFDPREDLRVSLAGHAGLRNSVDGPWQTVGGAIPGTKVESEVETRSVTLGFSVYF